MTRHPLTRHHPQPTVIAQLRCQPLNDCHLLISIHLAAAKNRSPLLRTTSCRTGASSRASWTKCVFRKWLCLSTVGFGCDDGPVITEDVLTDLIERASCPPFSGRLIFFLRWLQIKLLLLVVLLPLPLLLSRRLCLEPRPPLPRKRIFTAMVTVFPAQRKQTPAQRKQRQSKATQGRRA